MVRSVFEAATLSCFSVFDPGGLDFRASNSLDQPYRDSTTNLLEDPKVRYVPARVIVEPDDEGRGMQIQLLDGREPRDQVPKISADRKCVESPVMPCALLQAFDPKVMVGKRPGKPMGVWNDLDQESKSQFGQERCVGGSAVIAVIGKLQPHGGNRAKFYYSPVHWVRRVEDSAHFASLATDILANLRAVPDSKLVFGYLHRTGPNIENKKFERVFFDGSAPFNKLNAGKFEEHVSGNTSDNLFQQFNDAVVPTNSRKPVTDDVVFATQLVLEGHSERQAADAKKSGKVPRVIVADPKPPYPSDFVGTTNFKKGDLFYALIDDMQGGDVSGLYPVAMPRQPHEDTRGHLLPEFFKPCSPADNENPPCLCPACRVFGWVRDLTGRKGVLARSDRIDAWAGHVRFTNGVYLDTWKPHGDKQPELTPLAILGAPKPTTTMFYLQKCEEFENAKAARRPPILRNVNPPLYRKDEAYLRGRKFYRHKTAKQPSSTNFAEGGLMQTAGGCNSQNQSVHLMPDRMRFAFRVYFDNLTQEELGALLFALSLRLPKKGGWHEPVDRTNKALRHSLGRGKPLGMGACEIEIVNVQRLGGDGKPASRYDELDLTAFDKKPSVKEATRPDACDTATWSNELNAFGAAWDTIQSTAGQVRDDLIEMLAAEPPDGPIHYPTRPLSEHCHERVVAPVNNFAWFVDAKKKRNPPKLPAPQQERPVDNKTGLPYSVKQG